jgi:hypothetical protein
MTYEWQGSSLYTPGAEVSLPTGGSPSVHVFALAGTDRVVLSWVTIDGDATLPSRHCAAIGPITNGIFTPDTEVRFGESSIYGGTGSPTGGSSCYVDNGGLFFVSYFYDGSTGSWMVLTRTGMDLSAPVTKVINVSDGSDQAYTRNVAVAFNGHYFRLSQNPANPESVTVTALDSSFNDGATSTFTLADPTSRLGAIITGPMVSANYACSGVYLEMQVMMHFNGTTIDDVWTFGGAPTVIIAGLPDFGSAFGGAFILRDGSGARTIYFDEGGRAWRYTGITLPVLGFGNYDATSMTDYSAGGVWTFSTGPEVG